MKIEDNTVVTMTYELRQGDEQGELLEIMNDKYPFEFLYGNGALLKSFEDKIRDLGEGDDFGFRIDAEDAYGYPRKEEIIDLSIDAFRVDGSIPEGLIEKDNHVNVTDDHGDRHVGRILEYDRNTVKVDFNHAMVGKDLHFKGTILRIRPASVDEIIKKHHIPST
ncbi:MAG: peptidylprolyl isomerase [Bacteroidota bacterium]